MAVITVQAYLYVHVCGLISTRIRSRVCEWFRCQCCSYCKYIAQMPVRMAGSSSPPHLPPLPRMNSRCLQRHSTTTSSSGPEFTTLLLHFIPGQLDVVYVLTPDETTCSDSAVNQRFAAQRPFVAPLCAITSPLLVMISMA